MHVYIWNICGSSKYDWYVAANRVIASNEKKKQFTYPYRPYMVSQNAQNALSPLQFLVAVYLNRFGKYSSGLLHRNLGNHTIAPASAK